METLERDLPKKLTKQRRCASVQERLCTEEEIWNSFFAEESDESNKLEEENGKNVLITSTTPQQ